MKKSRRVSGSGLRKIETIVKTGYRKKRRYARALALMNGANDIGGGII